MDTTIKTKAPRQGKKNQNSANPKKSGRKAGRNPKIPIGDMSKSLEVPVAQGRVRSARKPCLEGMSNGDIVISHREYIQDVAGSVAFAATVCNVNPGIPGTFPWLSAIAQRYESYIFENLVFEFETQSPTSATGTVLIALDYDASDAPPVDKVSALAYRSSVRSPPWADCTHISLQEDLRKHKTYFVRTSPLLANQDIKLYDVANAYLCTQGQASTAAIGELYVSYRVRLMTPQFGVLNPGLTVESGAFSGSSNAAPFATIVAGNLPVTIGQTGTTSSVTTFTFTQAWSGYVGIGVNGTGLTTLAPGGTCVRLTLQTLITGGTSGYSLVEVTATVGQTFQISCNNNTITAACAVFGEK